ncbi:MAG: hypothetical protein ACQKBU_10900, partial [Verrucomicrobiales bacterium]
CVLRGRRWGERVISSVGAACRRDVRDGSILPSAKRVELGAFASLRGGTVCARVSTVKLACVFALLLPLPSAVALEGTVWYDSEGEVVLVEGPAAESAPEPFVPEWRKREIERRERQGRYTSSIYEDWHRRGDDVRSWGGYGCRSAYVWDSRLIRRTGSAATFRTRSGRFFSSGACYRSGGTVIRVTWR